MSDGGYDEGYKVCPCFWGEGPAELVGLAIDEFRHVKHKSALDFGCGEGKNAAALATAGFRVVAIDRSSLAIGNAVAKYPNTNVNWLVCDLTDIHGPPNAYDVVLATGSLHCLNSPAKIESAVAAMKSLTKIGGLNIVSSFNDGPQDMSGHSAAFKPTLIPHNAYLSMYAEWEILAQSSTIQNDEHPHNEIEHSHSISRILARKRK